MIFSISLCGVTPGNHAKTQARRKGSRKVGTSVSMHVWTIIRIYYILITDFIIKVFLWICFLFSSAQPLTQQMQYIDMIIPSLDTWFGFCRGGRTCQAPSISRASSAHAKRCIQLEVRNGTPCSIGLFPPNFRQRKKARKIPEEFVRTTEEKRPTTHCSEGKAKESKERCHVL